jgi:hypothetical protein
MLLVVLTAGWLARLLPNFQDCSNLAGQAESLTSQYRPSLIAPGLFDNLIHAPPSDRFSDNL